MDEGKGTQLRVSLGAAQEDSQICPLWNLEKLEAGTGVNTQTFAPLPWTLCPLKSGHEEVAQCVCKCVFLLPALPAVLVSLPSP